MRESQRVWAARTSRLLLAVAICVGAATALGQGIPAGPLYVGVITPEPTDEPLRDAVARSALEGATMADEEFAFNAEMLGIEFDVLTRQATGAEAVVAAAEELVAEGAYLVAGGFSYEEAAALSEWSAGAGVAFLNVGSSADALRNEQCSATTLHLEPSAAMYLDSLAGWFVRSGYREWFFVRGDDPESEAQLQRALRGLRERHFGARSVGDAVVSADADLSDVAERVASSGADVVVMLLPAARQLEMLSALEANGVDAEVTGFPYPEAQTRAFYVASREASAGLGAGHRASAWEPTLDAYGARELNARYRLRFEDRPMEAPAWAVYQAVKLGYEAAFFGGGTEADQVLSYLQADTTVFDVWKGIGTTFRDWDGQLRQSLYLAKVNETSEGAFTAAILVGELPAIYMPGTDPVERLDQIGDLAGASACDR